MDRLELQIFDRNSDLQATIDLRHEFDDPAVTAALLIALRDGLRNSIRDIGPDSADPLYGWTTRVVHVTEERQVLP